MAYYTAGEFAKKAGVTSRTLRHYDEIGLLKPTARSESGYRLYCEEDMVTLQRIIALRYLRFSLQQIRDVLEMEEAPNILNSFQQQREEFIREKVHLEQIIRAIERLAENEKFSWDDMTKLIQLINADEKVQKHFTEDWWRKLGGVYAVAWHQFQFRQMEINPGDHIFELDVSDGTFWIDVVSEIPSGCHIVQTAMEAKALEKIRARQTAYPWEIDVKFDYEQCPSGILELSENAYDVVVASHLFIRSAELEKVLASCWKALKPGGRFYCTAIGHRHMREIRELVQKFEPGVHFYNMDSLEYFNKENGGDILARYFADVQWAPYQGRIEMKDVNMVCSYIWASYSNITDILSGRKKEMERYIQKVINRQGKIIFTDDSGVFSARKGTADLIK